MQYDPVLGDRLSELETIEFEGEVYRATPQSLDPLVPTRRCGRWSPNNLFPVLYTSLDRNGALAEIVFQWSQFTPLPSKPVFMHRIAISTRNTIKLSMADLEKYGVDKEDFQKILYDRTQKIGLVLDTLGHDGLIAPSARWECDNLIIFYNSHNPHNNLEILETEEIDWRGWAKKNGIEISNQGV